MSKVLVRKSQLLSEYALAPQDHRVYPCLLDHEATARAIAKNDSA